MKSQIQIAVSVLHHLGVSSQIYPLKPLVICIRASWALACHPIGQPTLTSRQWLLDGVEGDPHP
jgi:hypothetical protein